MARVVVINHVTLDGVMQAPGRPDEDTRNDFEHGGWSIPNNDDVMGAEMGRRMMESSGLILGRRTYDDLLSYWNAAGGPFKDALNSAPKYVVSRTLSAPLPWPNSTLIDGNVPDAITTIKGAAGNDVHVMGSGELIQTLLQAHLIDEFMLLTHPLVLGSGFRLFRDGGTSVSLELRGDAVTTTKGVVIGTYGVADVAS